MKSLKNIFKNKKGSSNVEIIMCTFTMIVTIVILSLIQYNSSFNEEIILNQNHTITSEMPVEESTTKKALNIIKGKEESIQNIKTNNTVKDKNDNLLYDFIFNLISTFLPPVAWFYRERILLRAKLLKRN